MESLAKIDLQLEQPPYYPHRQNHSVRSGLFPLLLQIALHRAVAKTMRSGSTPLFVSKYARNAGDETGTQSAERYRLALILSQRPNSQWSSSTFHALRDSGHKSSQYKTNGFLLRFLSRLAGIAWKIGDVS